MSTVRTTPQRPGTVPQKKPGKNQLYKLYLSQFQTVSERLKQPFLVSTLFGSKFSGVHFLRIDTENRPRVIMDVKKS